MFLRRVFAALVVLRLTSEALAAQTPDPMAGSWKLNVAESKTTFKSGMTVIESDGDSVKTTVDVVAGDGKAYHWTWNAKYDGKDYPVMGVTPYGENGTAALTRVDPRTAKIVAKLGGKATLTQVSVVSADGKTRTVRTEGQDAGGQPFSSTALYNKQ